MFRDCSAFKVRRLSRQVTQLYDQALRPEGLKSTQVHLLTVIGEEGPLSVGRLAELIGADRTSVTRALQATEAEGWVEIGPGRDGRSKAAPCSSGSSRRGPDRRRPCGPRSRAWSPSASSTTWFARPTASRS